MTELNVPGEQGIGGMVELVMARVLKKDHEANLQITKQFADMVKEYGATYFIFQLNSTDTHGGYYQHSPNCFSQPG